MHLNKYLPERITVRAGHIQNMYHRHLSALENFMFPVIIYKRDGTIMAANYFLRVLAKFNEEDIQLEKLNMFDYWEEQPGLAKTARDALDGRESVYRGKGCLIKTNENNPDIFQLSRYENAMFFPISHDNGAYTLFGALLDTSITRDDEVI